ncbi:MAG: AI-2E family transporter [Polyangiaceae bacterium]
MSSDHPAPVPPPLRIELTLKTMLMAVLVAGGAWVVLRLAPVALAVVVALFIVGTLSPIVEWLERMRVKRGVGIAIVFVSGVLLVGGLLALTLPALVSQFTSLVDQEPAFRKRLVELLSHYRATASLADSLRDVDYGTLLKGAASAALAYSTRSAEIVAYLASAVFLALYIMIDRDRLRGGLYALVPRKHHVRLSHVLIKLEVIVGGYIRGQLLTSGLMAAFTCVLLLVCGVKSALAIGVIAGVADLLPYVGVFLSVGPAVAAAASRGTVILIVVLVAMLAYEELESRFLVPRIYGNLLKLPSSVVLFSLLAGGTLMGITGALLALPVAAAVRMLIEELPIDLPGEDIDDPQAGIRYEQATLEYDRRARGVPAEAAAAIAVDITKTIVEEERRKSS